MSQQFKVVPAVPKEGDNPGSPARVEPTSDPADDKTIFANRADAYAAANIPDPEAAASGSSNGGRRRRRNRSSKKDKKAMMTAGRRRRSGKKGKGTKKGRR
jgi:hypothetical protein